MYSWLYVFVLMSVYIYYLPLTISHYLSLYRWYRAPEILVGWGKYSASVDMWALRTILAELIGRTPMLPGGDSVMQIDLIIQHLGKVGVYMYVHMGGVYVYSVGCVLRICI